MRTAYLVFNPHAGRFPSHMLTERAAEVLAHFEWQVRLEQSSGGLEVTRLAQQAAAEGADAFFIAGGDGSVNLAVAGLLGSDTALGVLPAGTTNVWAKELGLPGLTYTRWKALEESAQSLAQGEIRWIDVGLCGSRPFLLWAGVGLDGFIVHRLEPRSRWEKHFSVVSYGTRAVRHAGFWSGMDLEAVADDKHISGHYLMAVVSNIHLYAGGMAEISPYARLDDGVMDLWLFAGDTVWETIQHAWDLFSGQHLQSDRARCLPFQRLKLCSDRPMYIQLDGEPMDGEKEISIEVRSQALKILAPEHAPRALFSEED
jgi:YegS/Rv2252/BmrU family lipid kinase